MRLKDIAYLNPAYTGPDLRDTLVSFSPMECLRYDELNSSTIQFSVAKGKYTYFSEKDILFAKVTPCFENQNIAIAYNLTNGIGFGSSEINVVRLKLHVSHRYMFYLLCSNHFFNIGCASMCGVGGLKRISPRAVSTFEFDLPSLVEQKAIAAYLDKECETIRRRIALLERKAYAYRRLRRSLINQAVTRGLNPDVPLKLSGNKWIGDIPAHWKFERIEKIFHSKTLYNSEFSYKHAFKFFMGTIVPKDENLDAEEYQDAYEKYTIVEQNDIIINGLNLNYDLKSMRVGKVPYKGIITSAYVVLRPYNNINTDFFNYLFKAFDYRKFFHGMGKGIRLTLSFNELRYFEIPIPPENEQKEIATYLDEKCAKIDAIVEKINNQIERLKELKRSLINEVITGKRAINTIQSC